jgi:hypothetical protein
METENYKLGHHLVAFLDVLGQRDKFKGLRLPTNAEEEAHVKEILRQTAGFVVGLRKVFQNVFKAFEAGSATLRAHTMEPLRPNFVGFSDSFVTSVPLARDGGDLVRVSTVFSALSAAAAVMLTSLASKHPMRGGIDVGLATEIGRGEIYGTALERAYLLECKMAKYPRIVIGDELWRYLKSALMEFEKDTTRDAKAITAIVQKIMEFIATDADGNRILDYLGAVMVQHSGPDHAKHMVQPTYEFALAEQKRLIVEGSPELIARYASFRSYVDSRLPLWHITVVKS